MKLSTVHVYFNRNARSLREMKYVRHRSWFRESSIFLLLNTLHKFFLLTLVCFLLSFFSLRKLTFDTSVGRGSTNVAGTNKVSTHIMQSNSVKSGTETNTKT
jgi:hypothetical protein